MSRVVAGLLGAAKALKKTQKVTNKGKAIEALFRPAKMEGLHAGRKPKPYNPTAVYRDQKAKLQGLKEGRKRPVQEVGLRYRKPPVIAPTNEFEYEEFPDSEFQTAVKNQVDAALRDVKKELKRTGKQLANMRVVRDPQAGIITYEEDGEKNLLLRGLRNLERMHGGGGREKFTLKNAVVQEILEREGAQAIGGEELKKAAPRLAKAWRWGIIRNAYLAWNTNVLMKGRRMIRNLPFTPSGKEERRRILEEAQNSWLRGMPVRAAVEMEERPAVAGLMNKIEFAEASEYETRGLYTRLKNLLEGKSPTGNAAAHRELAEKGGLLDSELMSRVDEQKGWAKPRGKDVPLIRGKPPTPEEMKGREERDQKKVEQLERAANWLGGRKGVLGLKEGVSQKEPGRWTKEMTQRYWMVEGIKKEADRQGIVAFRLMEQLGLEAKGANVGKNLKGAAVFADPEVRELAKALGLL